MSNRLIFNVLNNIYPENNLLIEDINNIRKKIKIEHIGNENELKILIENISNLSWKYHMKRNEDNSIHSFLIIPSSSYFLYSLFPHVLIIDATIKTNKEEFLLIEGVGICNTWKSFNFFYCFSATEKEDDYVWMFEVIKSDIPTNIFPNVIATDKSTALSNAISRCFPNTKHVLCMCFNFLFLFYTVFNREYKYEYFSSSFAVL
jgi:hypothetical protein